MSESTNDADIKASVNKYTALYLIVQQATKTICAKRGIEVDSKKIDTIIANKLIAHAETMSEKKTGGIDKMSNRLKEGR